MKKKTNLLIIISLILILLVVACSPKPKGPTTEEVGTQIAQTVAVGFTRTAEARPTATPVPTMAPMPTALPMPTFPVPTAVIIFTPVVSPVVSPAVSPVVSPTATVPSGGTDAGVWARSDPKDGTNIPAGSSFTVVVTLMNTGNTTWTSAYSIQFKDGAQMGASGKYAMPYAVPPGAQVQITLPFTAPANTGTVKSNWMIMNANGVAFSLFWFEYNIV